MTEDGRRSGGGSEAFWALVLSSSRVGMWTSAARAISAYTRPNSICRTNVSGIVADDTPQVSELGMAESLTILSASPNSRDRAAHVPMWCSLQS